MPPKANPSSDGNANGIAGFDARETRFLAAAFISQIGTDKYDYQLMATLTGNTPGSLQKMVPPVKRKAADKYPSFAGFLGAPSSSGKGGAAAANANGDDAPKAKKGGGRKRKVAETSEEGNGDAEAETDTGGEKKKTKGRGRPKKVKDEEEKENSANGGNDDSMYTDNQEIMRWMTADD
ncbi:hypothetical protein K469DRAFT_509480, partial [Zopfia rhizophila CBS 207.26]